MKQILAPNDFKGKVRPWLFLAGSIDMGTAEHWQERVVRLLHGSTGTILNPRRDDWDNTWVQSIHNRQFRQQVEWELEAQESADRIALYISSESSAPITLLELGLFAHKAPNITVCCPDGFFRKGNVDIVCKRYKVPQVDTLEELVEAVSGPVRTLVA